LLLLCRRALRGRTRATVPGDPPRAQAGRALLRRRALQQHVPPPGGEPGAACLLRALDGAREGARVHRVPLHAGGDERVPARHRLRGHARCARRLLPSLVEGALRRPVRRRVVRALRAQATIRVRPHRPGRDPSHPERRAVALVRGNLLRGTGPQVSTVSSRQIEHGAEGEHAPPAAPAPAPVGHLRELDALRGVAILLVFFYHCDTVVRHEAHGAGPLFAFVRAGHTGVSLFFVLSGFLLAFPFLAEAEGGRHVRRREYALRRAMRILPMYYLALLVALWWLHPIAEWPSSWPFLVFMNPLAGPFALWPFSIGWWSLSTEVQFYLLLPLLPLLACTAPRALLTFGAYTVVYILFMLHLWQPPTLDLEVYLPYAIFGRAPLFLSGIVAAWLWRRDGAALRRRLAGPGWMARGGADLLLLLAAAALSWILQWVAWVGFWQAERPPNHMW